MSNGAGKDYGGALLAQAREAGRNEVKLEAARGVLLAISEHPDCPIIIKGMAEVGLEASK